MAKKKDDTIKKLKKEIKVAVAAAQPEALTLDGRSPVRDCHAGNIVQLVGWGQTRLAADHVLFPEINGSLLTAVSGAARRLGVKFYMANLSGAAEQRAQNILTRYYAYEYMLETMLNFFGHESALLDQGEKDLATDFIVETLCSWENWEKDEYGEALIAQAAVDGILAGMELVQGGASMVAKSAARIRKTIKDLTPVTLEFLLAANEEIQDNIYYVMVDRDLCKFGNDYALGLRWLRHLGYEQVSTNPVLAALAYKDDPSLAETFKKEAAKHPCISDWLESPEKYGDDIALFATLQALWDNLHVYRPVFYNLADSTGGGVVSFQLNPNIAHLADASIRDALTALEYAQADLDVYDAYLLAGYDTGEELGRPNMVIKVAASHPAARTIARTINEHGLGSNVTVVYTVAQQVTLILEEMAGMAAAVKKGILPTQLYMTNMGGRFESHLREDALLRLFDRLKRKIGKDKALRRVTALAKANGSLEKVKAAESFSDKVFAATCYASGVKAIDAPIIRALQGVADKKELTQLEDDIMKSGTLVARRVWRIFFSEKNREKWVAYLCDAHQLVEHQARFILSRINYLPASKRKPLDTFWTLTADNMVHTEFGNHQENVLQMALADDFELDDFVESIRDAFEPDVVTRLNKLPDFVTGYELNAEMNRVLRAAGIEGDFGRGGHSPAKWQDFGSVQKTSEEFKKAYNNFRDYILGLL